MRDDDCDLSIYSHFPSLEHDVCFFTSPDATASPGMKSSGYMFSKYHWNDLHFNFLLSSLRDVMSP